MKTEMYEVDGRPRQMTALKAANLINAGKSVRSFSDKSLKADIEDKSVAELRKLATKHEIEGRSSMNKEELIEALEN